MAERRVGSMLQPEVHCSSGAWQAVRMPRPGLGQVRRRRISVAMAVGARIGQRLCWPMLWGLLEYNLYHLVQAETAAVPS